MKTLAIAAVAVLSAVAVANRPVDITNLQNLSALEEAESLAGTTRAFTWVNEKALNYLPVAATLRAENAVAGVALRLAGQSAR